MQTIVKFRADDGSEHTTEESAKSRDALHHACARIMARLPQPPPEVEAGKGWAQHNLETVNQCKDAVLELCREQGLDAHYPAFKHKGRDCHTRSIIGRILDDMGGPLNKAWCRFSKIDDQGREHQQPYFAYNGPDTHHVCVVDFS